MMLRHLPVIILVACETVVILADQQDTPPHTLLMVQGVLFMVLGIWLIRIGEGD